MQNNDGDTTLTFAAKEHGEHSLEDDDTTQAMWVSALGLTPGSDTETEI